MPQPESSSCNFFTIAYVANITFGLNPEQSIYNVPQMQLHNNINNKTISSFPKYSHSNTLQIGGQMSLVVHSNAEPKFICLYIFNVSKALNVFMWLSKNILAYNKYIWVEIKFPLL